MSVARLEGPLAERAPAGAVVDAVSSSAPPARAEKAQPRILFLDLTNDPGSDRIAAEMGRSGALCAVVGVRSAFSARSRFVRRFFPLPHWGGLALRSFVLGRRLEDIVRDWSPDLIMPTDDLAARVIRDRRIYRRASPALRRLIERSFGDPAGFAVACSRQGLAEAARAVGVRMPRQAIVGDLDAAGRTAAAFGYPVVLKRELSCGGFGVAIARDEEELASAFRRSRLRAAAKRLLGWAPGFSLEGQAPLTLQRYVRGALAYRVVACVDGVETEGVSFVAQREDAEETSASAIVRRLDHAEMRETTRRIVAALRCSGIVSLDFILDDAGEAYLIELNARPIASGHLGRLYGHDVYAAAIGTRAGEPAPVPPRAIALFPRALDRDPTGAHLATSSGVLHDVPWDDEGVVRAYARWLRDRHPRCELGSLVA